MIHVIARPSYGELECSHGEFVHQTVVRHVQVGLLLITDTFHPNNFAVPITKRLIHTQFECLIYSRRIYKHKKRIRKQSLLRPNTCVPA